MNPDHAVNAPLEDIEGDCDDPRHNARCDCGATPDLNYERANDI